MSRQKRKRLFYIISICLFLSSFPMILIPFGDFEGSQSQRILLYTIGILFWLGLVVGYAVFLYMNQTRKKVDPDSKNIGKPGICSFWSNLWAKIADTGMVAGLAGVILCVITKRGNAYLELTVLAIFLFSLHMHGLLNGRIYSFVFGSDVEEKREEAAHDVEK